MINIVSKSIYQYHPSGPKKVIDNFVLGLKELGIPYTINLDPTTCAYNIIHDDIEALTYIVKQYESTHGEGANSTSHINQPSYVIGPNICTTPQDLEHVGISLASSFFQTYDFLVPAPWVADFYRAHGFTGNISVWASGIQTDYFSPVKDQFVPEQSHTHQSPPSQSSHPATSLSHPSSSLSASSLSTNSYLAKPILLYTKGRDVQDIRAITDFLEQHALPYIHMAYGSYTETELIETARRARFGIIVDSSESQGIAIEELMSINLPLVVYDISFWNQNISAGGGTNTGTTAFPATSIPYFDDICGYTSIHLAEVHTYILRINEELQQSNHRFSPRTYILNQLSLKKQAKELCDILHYPSHSFSYTGPVRYWKNRTWYRPYLLVKYIVKYLLWKKEQR
jgi:hypothetical protein